MFDIKKLAADIQAKVQAQKTTTWAAMREIGVYESFYNQLVDGRVPRANTLVPVLRWLGTRFEDYVDPGPPENGQDGRTS